MKLVRIGLIEAEKIAPGTNRKLGSTRKYWINNWAVRTFWGSPFFDVNY